jgi:hypothetical protein
MLRGAAYADALRRNGCRTGRSLPHPICSPPSTKTSLRKSKPAERGDKVESRFALRPELGAIISDTIDALSRGATP